MSDSKPKFKGYSEDNKDVDHTPDPTAMTGTLDTSDTDGQLHTAADVTVGGGVDEEALAPEGALGGKIDPEATGEDALKPDYTDEQKRLDAQRQSDATAGAATNEGEADKAPARKAAAKTTTAKTAAAKQSDAKK